MFTAIAILLSYITVLTLPLKCRPIRFVWDSELMALEGGCADLAVLYTAIAVSNIAFRCPSIHDTHLHNCSAKDAVGLKGRWWYYVCDWLRVRCYSPAVSWQCKAEEYLGG